MELLTVINELTAESEVAMRSGRRDLHDALQIGIEAVKVLQRSRLGDPPLDGELLPGETGV